MGRVGGRGRGTEWVEGKTGVWRTSGWTVTGMVCGGEGGKACLRRRRRRKLKGG